jgi:hypothetical protein
MDLVHTSDALAEQIKIHGPSPSTQREVKLLEKLSRYLRITDLLMRSSRRHDIFNNIEIIPVKLQPTKGLTVEPDEAIADATRRLLSTSRGQKLLNPARKTNFVDTMELIKHAATSNHPVHAEMQLLGHYEITSSCLRPRVISSNKQACFLCNLFFRVHGVFLMSSSHGRLYEKWTLPRDLLMSVPSSRSNMFATIRNFEDQISRRIEEELVSRRARLPQPEESIIFPSRTGSTSTVVPHPRPYQDLEDRTSSGSAEWKPFRDTGISLTSYRPSRSVMPSGTSSWDPIYPGNALRTGNAYVVSDKVLKLQQGVPVCIVFSERTRDIRVHTPKIHLCLTTIPGYNSHESTTSRCSEVTPSHKNQPTVQVEWLSGEHNRGSDQVLHIKIEEIGKGVDDMRNLEQMPWPRSIEVNHKSESIRMTYITRREGVAKNSAAISSQKLFHVSHSSVPELHDLS